MTNSFVAELYFIAAMMILIFIVCGTAVYFFFTTYKKEMKEKAERIKQKEAEKAAALERERAGTEI